MTRRGARRAGALLLVFATAACTAKPGGAPRQISSGPALAPVSGSGASTGSGPARRWDHVVVVVMGTRSYGEVIGQQDAPFVNLLARSGAAFTDAHAVAGTSSANYFALFSASTQGVTKDSCPHHFDGPNLATQLTVDGLSFAAYSQDLPKAGYRGCATGAYTAVHNPLVAFTNVPASMNQPLSAFRADYDRLPDVSFVIPSLTDSMTESEVAEGDTWLRETITGYAAWASSHRSLLVITWDQAPAADATNHIPMIAIGSTVTGGSLIAARVDHYQLLATVEDGFGLSRMGNTAGIEAIGALG